MIIVAGTIPIRADKREEAIEAALWMAEQTNQEEGCISYAFFADLKDPNLFHIFEEWESGEALAAHFEAPHMAEFRQRIPNFVAGPGKRKRYEVSSSSKM